MLLNCNAGRVNAFCQKITEAYGVKLKFILLAGVLLFSAGALVALNNMIQARLLRVEHNEKTVQAMLSLAKKHALTVKTLQVSKPVQAVKESAAKAGINLTLMDSDKPQARLRISETTLPRFTAWVDQLNDATGVQLRQVVLLPTGNSKHIQVEALLVWERPS